MALNYMTGIPRRSRVKTNRIIINPDAFDQMDGIGKRKAFAKIKKKLQEAKKSVKDATSSLTKGKNRIAKIGLAPARASFLLAVNMNILKIASKLETLYKKDKQKVVDFWEKFGGDIGKLKRAIEKGTKHSLSGLGEPITLTGALASALPILMQVFKLFKREGLQSGDDDAKAGSLIDQAKSILELDPSVPKDQVDLPNDDTGKTADVSKIKPGEEEKLIESTDEEKPWYKKPEILIGGAVVVGGLVYLATKKKKTN